MSTHGGQVPSGREAEQRWRRLDWTKRIDMVLRGNTPETQDEALTALGYARRMLDKNEIWAFLGALSAFVVVLALEMIVQSGLTGQSLILAGGIGVGVGLGLEIGGRMQARKLESRAERALIADETTDS